MRLFVREIGTGRAGPPALVFLHYFGGSSREWETVTAALSPSRRCLAVDLRGFGDSPDGDTHTVAEMAGDVRETLDALSLGDYILIGHSMGGKVALSLAAQNPPGLRALALVAPSPPTPEPMTEEGRQKTLNNWGNAKASAETHATITAHPLPAPLAALFVADNLRSTRAAWQDWMLVGSRENLADQMPRISVPVEVLGGECDPVVEPQVLQTEVVARLPGASWTLVPNAGHLLPFEAPGAVVELIQGLLPAAG